MSVKESVYEVLKGRSMAKSRKSHVMRVLDFWERDGLNMKCYDDMLTLCERTGLEKDKFWFGISWLQCNGYVSHSFCYDEQNLKIQYTLTNNQQTK